MESLSLLLLFGCCFLGVMVIAVIAGVSYSRRREGPRAEDILPNLAREMGLTPLDAKHPQRFGETYKDHAFYIDRGFTGSVSSRSVSLGKGLAVSVEVQMREPKQGYAYCNRGRVSPTTTFDSAFSAKLEYEWISAPARKAMLAFVRKREDLFLEGLPIRPKLQSTPEANVRLQHNMPNDTQITQDEVYAVLDQLIEIARVIETTC
jgi:hypothetical protein